MRLLLLSLTLAAPALAQEKGAAEENEIIKYIGTKGEGSMVLTAPDPAHDLPIADAFTEKPGVKAAPASQPLVAPPIKRKVPAGAIKPGEVKPVTIKPATQPATQPAASGALMSEPAPAPKDKAQAAEMKRTLGKAPVNRAMLKRISKQRARANLKVKGRIPTMDREKVRELRRKACALQAAQGKRTPACEAILKGAKKAP